VATAPRPVARRRKGGDWRRSGADRARPSTPRWPARACHAGRPRSRLQASSRRAEATPHIMFGNLHFRSRVVTGVHTGAPLGFAPDDQHLRGAATSAPLHSLAEASVGRSPVDVLLAPSGAGAGRSPPRAAGSIREGGPERSAGFVERQERGGALPTVLRSPRGWVALLSLRIRGRERVARHAELAMLAKLSCALMGEGAIHPAA
jgi:hypothetical protein